MFKQALTTAALIIVSGSALGQSNCFDVINMKDVYLSQGTQNSYSAQRYAACSMSFKEHNDTYKASAEGTYKFIGGQGSYDQGNYDQWKTQNCNSGSSEQYAQAAYLEFRKIAPPEAYATADKCLEQTTFYCVATQDQGSGTVTISLKQTLGGSYKFSDDLYPDYVKPLDNQKLKGQRVGFGKKTLVFKRTKPDQFNLPLNIEDNNITATCNVYVPRDVKSETRSYDVDAKANSRTKSWLSTGFDLKPGSMLTAFASGKGRIDDKNHDPVSETDPNGNTWWCGDNDLPCGALIAKIGNSKPFVIGSHYHNTINDSGALQLAFQDVNSEDNGGGYHITISVESDR